MQLNIHLSEEELLALLYLPFFRTPNQLSPFYQLQMEEAGLQNDPEEGLSRLYQKGLWNPREQELTLEGRQLFIPVFAPTARVMLFQSAHSSTPFQEFYIYKKYVSQYIEHPNNTVCGPKTERDLVEHLRAIFGDRRVPYTENQLSLFESEFILLVTIAALQKVGEPPTMERLLQHIQENFTTDGLMLPVLGRMDNSQGEHPAVHPEALESSMYSLLDDGLIEQAEDGSLYPSDLIDQLFRHVCSEQDIYLLREEFDKGQLLAREVSIFPGEQGYFLGRSSYNEQFDARLVHLEDMEWHTLYRLINEIGRHRDYLPQLTLEINKRYHAHLRG